MHIGGCVFACMLTGGCVCVCAFVCTWGGEHNFKCYSLGAYLFLLILGLLLAWS